MKQAGKVLNLAGHCGWQGTDTFSPTCLLPSQEPRGMGWHDIELEGHPKPERREEHGGSGEQIREAALSSGPRGKCRTRATRHSLWSNGWMGSQGRAGKRRGRAPWPWWKPLCQASPGSLSEAGWMLSEVGERGKQNAPWINLSLPAGGPSYG